MSGNSDSFKEYHLNIGIELKPERVLATSLRLLGQLNNAALFWVFARFGQHDLFTLMNWMFLYAAEEALALRKMLRPSEFCINAVKCCYDQTI